MKKIVKFDTAEYFRFKGIEYYAYIVKPFWTEFKKKIWNYAQLSSSTIKSLIFWELIVHGEYV